MYGKPGIRRAVVQTVGFVVLAAVPVLVLNTLATVGRASGSPASTFGSSTRGVAAMRPLPPLLVDAVAVSGRATGDGAGDAAGLPARLGVADVEPPARELLHLADRRPQLVAEQPWVAVRQHDRQ